MRQRTILWLLFTGILCSSGPAQTFEFLGGKTLSDITNLSQDYGIPSSLYDAVSSVEAYRVTYTMPFLGEEITVSGVAFEPTDLDPCVRILCMSTCTEPFLREVTRLPSWAAKGKSAT